MSVAGTKRAREDHTVMTTDAMKATCTKFIAHGPVSLSTMSVMQFDDVMVHLRTESVVDAAGDMFAMLIDICNTGKTVMTGVINVRAFIFAYFSCVRPNIVFKEEWRGKLETELVRAGKNLIGYVNDFARAAEWTYTFSQVIPEAILAFLRLFKEWAIKDNKRIKGLIERAVSTTQADIAKIECLADSPGKPNWWTSETCFDSDVMCRVPGRLTR